MRFFTYVSGQGYFIFNTNLSNCKRVFTNYDFGSSLPFTVNSKFKGLITRGVSYNQGFSQPYVFNITVTSIVNLSL